MECLKFDRVWSVCACVCVSTCVPLSFVCVHTPVLSQCYRIQLRGVVFPCSAGPDRDVDSAGKFIEGEFKSRNHNKDKIIYAHFTTATDTSNIQVVFKVVLETIIRENLEAAQLI